MEEGLGNKGYTKLKNIATGVNGIVYRAKCNATGLQVAIKKDPEKMEHDDEYLEFSEYHASKVMDHPRTIKLLDTIVMDKYIHYVYELMDMDLCEYLDRGLNIIREKRQFLHDLFDGLAYIHELGLVHGDIKPHNLLILRGRLKIADFGTTETLKRCKEDKDYLKMGTLWYRSPEQILGYHSGFSVDIWAAGTVVAEALLNRPLFPGDSYIDQLYHMFRLLGTPTDLPYLIHSSYALEKMPKWPSSLSTRLDSVPPLCASLLKDILVFDPSARPTAANCKNHSFFHIDTQILND